MDEEIIPFLEPFADCAFSRMGAFHVAQFMPQGVFWDVWRDNKADMKLAGVSVFMDAQRKFTAQLMLSPADFEVFCSHYHMVDDSFIDNQELETPSEFDIPFDILYPIQQESTAWLCNSIKQNKCALNGSGTGVGKTYMTFGVAQGLEIPKILAITPYQVSAQWQRAAFKFGYQDTFKWVNYEKLRRGTTKYGTYIEKDGQKGFVFNTELLKPSEWLLAFDEIQCCKGLGTLNCKVLEASARQKYMRIGSSATPLVDITDARALTAFLGLRKGAWATWLKEFTGTDDVRAQKHTRHVKKLSALIYGGWARGHRIARSKLPENYFPKDSKEVRMVTMQDSEDLQKTYRRHAQMMEKLKGASKQIHKNDSDLDSVGDSSDHDGNTQDAWDDQIAWLEDAREAAYQAEQPLQVRLRTMMLVEMHKVAVFVDMAETFMEEGNSVPIFLNYKWPVRHVAARLKTNCVIMGGISQQERQSSLAKFQNNIVHCCVLNLASGGTGIDLHNEKMEGRTPRDRVSLISVGDKALDVVQAFGRTNRANSADGARTMQIVVMIDGVETEQRIADSLTRKLACIEEFNQNDMNLALSF